MLQPKDICLVGAPNLLIVRFRLAFFEPQSPSVSIPYKQHAVGMSVHLAIQTTTPFADNWDQYRVVVQDMTWMAI